ncbi:Ldh family oxidoreductase [Microbacterium sp. NPDC076895]|uniref:Ldh family oxidoreductase n=1 Tax=Microbacterium sp. NPDC076895 TaxID=3154957 RepID=UPI003445061F
MSLLAANPTVSPARLQSTATQILQGGGVPANDAELIATSLVEADRRGTHSHGVMRLPLYVQAVRTGGINPSPTMKWAREQGATAILDAGNGFGQVAMAHALEKGRQLVAKHATAVVAVRGSSHYGAGAYWTSQLSNEGLVAFLISTTGASVTPFGGAEKVLGTNPLTISFPTGANDPVVLDMASSNGAYGRIVEASKEHHPIPAGWAVDAKGQPTTNPDSALSGALLPFGGHKGSGLAVLLELLAGPLAGGNIAAETTDMWDDPSSPMGTGHLLWIVDPVGLQGDESPIHRAASFQDRLRNVTPAQESSKVLSPGDIEHQKARENTEQMPMPASTLEDIAKLAQELGLEQDLLTD